MDKVQENLHFCWDPDSHLDLQNKMAIPKHWNICLQRLLLSFKDFDVIRNMKRPYTPNQLKNACEISLRYDLKRMSGWALYQIALENNFGAGINLTFHGWFALLAKFH